jgi:hypothetical protein
MKLPSILMGILISTLIGAAFHLLKGGGLGRLILYLLLGWVGFWTGQLAADQLGWNLWTIGQLHLGMAAAGSLLFLSIGHWLSLIDVENA